MIGGKLLCIPLRPSSAAGIAEERGILGFVERIHLKCHSHPFYGIMYAEIDRVLLDRHK